MSFSIQLTTRDSKQLDFTCTAEQTVVEAAAAAQIILPTQCRQGGCGTCFANITKGDYLFGEHDADLLPADDATGVLLCRILPRSDLQISLPFDLSKIILQVIPHRSGEITILEQIAEHTIRLGVRLEPDEEGNSAAEFEPGQFMELELPGAQERRAYSLANISNWDGQLEFLIRLQPHGRFSAFLRERAKLGMKLMLHGPQGSFGINTGSLRPRWFVAGGTGLAPMLSMLRRMAEYQETQDARLFFGVNRESELFALEELKRLQTDLPQLKVELCVWKPEGNWNGFVGTPANALQQALTVSDGQPDFYLCGPPPFIEASEKTIANAGIPATQVFAERFLPSV